MKIYISHEGMTVEQQLPPEAGKKTPKVKHINKKVDVDDLPAHIRALSFDTVTGKGHIEYAEGVTYNVEVRDFALEQQEYQEALLNNKPLDKLVPRYTSKAIQKEPDVLTDFGPYQQYLDRYNAS